MRKFPWNENTNVFRWDPEQGREFLHNQTPKQMLSNPNGVYWEDAIANCMKGLAMVMDEIERLEEFLKEKRP